MTSKVEIWEASATLAFIPVMILTRYDGGLVNCPLNTQPACFAHFDICICQSHNKCQSVKRENTAGQLAQDDVDGDTELTHLHLNL